MQIRACFCLALIATTASVAAAAEQSKQLELKLNAETVRGKLMAHNRHLCWVLERNGNLREVALQNVTEFRKTSKSFQRMKAVEMRKQLRDEFGKRFEIKATQHYVVCASEGKAKEYARLFEKIYRTFSVHFSARGAHLTKPEFPLVAIVFPDFKSFATYSQKEGVRAFPQLKGYYHPVSNRIALYDDGSEQVAIDATPVLPQTGFRWHAKVSGSLRDTVIHEATHQVAFNVGIHSRIGKSPTWVVEGLATLFEAPGIRNRSHDPSVTRINSLRLRSFQEFVKKRRQEKSLADFIQNDTLFRSSIHDAYGQAWALSYFLMETRSAKYMRYLKMIAQRDALQPYTSQQRLSDFKEVFGNDLDKLEVSFLRYLAREQ